MIQHRYKPIEVQITPRIAKEAQDRNDEFQSKFGNLGTHRTSKDRQRMTGYLAEACIKHEFPTLQYSDDYAVDFRLGPISLDSKAQGCNSRPMGDYNATLYEEQKDRDADYYIFTRVKNDFSVAWICGLISKARFMRIAELQKAGTVTNNFTYEQARFEIQYKELAKVSQLIEWYEKRTFVKPERYTQALFEGMTENASATYP